MIDWLPAKQVALGGVIGRRTRELAGAKIISSLVSDLLQLCAPFCPTSARGELAGDCWNAARLGQSLAG